MVRTASPTKSGFVAFQPSTNGRLVFKIGVGEYTLICHDGALHGNYLQHARLVEEFDQVDDRVKKCVFAVNRGLDWPFLVVKQGNRHPDVFHPGALLALETRVLFIGVGERLLAYELDGPTRLWEETTCHGFWGWARHSNFIIMSAELELTAWDIHGRKHWTMFVEPPWEYRVVEGTVHLDVMGRLTSFQLDTGPAISHIA